MSDEDIYRDYAKDETWETFQRDGKTWARVSGRKRIPDEVKRRLNFIFKLDGTEQWLDDGSTSWWAPGWPQWIRVVTWYARNPFASRYISTVVLGVQDRNYEVEVTEGRTDLPLLTQPDDTDPPGSGWQKATLHLDDGSKRYWRAYVGKWLTYYYGCQPSGLFALKWNFPKHSAFGACLLAVLLAGCGSSSPPPPPPLADLPAAYTFTGFGFQYSPGMAGDASHFNFPHGPDAAGAASVHYVVARVPGKITGKRVVLDYEIVENAPVYQGALGDPNNTCGPPAHFSLYLQRRGDQMTAAFPYHRWFNRVGELKAGRRTVSAPFDTNWTGVFGQPNLPALQQTLAEPANIGLTFGWGCFAGHGVNLASGASTFIIHSFRTSD